ncbi:retroviral-like aspartic protease family protein [Prosthecobacter sp. SYSU 5D2]|uniref:retroviral-like aspartic protease family protein n=1 Tax=Prosthecobacter sp. SYSU 5D2 TaxID=3134134 RepID=UPI0031FE7C58
MRFTPLFLLLLLLAGCSQLADHGPVSARTQARMEALVLTKEEFLKRVQSPRMKPAGPVTVAFQLKAGVPVIDVTINGGKKLPMMVDTGASRTMIHATTAVAKQVSLLSAVDATVEMQGVIGSEKGRIGLLDSLEVGGWTLGGYPCLVRTFQNHTADTGFPDCLMGFDVALEHCSYLTFDYRNKKITFGFGGSFSSPVGKRAAFAPFKVKHGVPFITLEAGGKSWEAIVDTGSFNGVEISEEVAKKLGVQNQGVEVKGLYLMAVGGTVSSGQVKMRTVRLPELKFFGDRYRDVDIDIAPGPPRVGSHFLKDYRVTFDIRRKRLWLEW